MKILFILILSFLLCSCDPEIEMISEYVGKGFGTPISESVVEVCYKEHLYRVEITKRYENYGHVNRVIPILENNENNNAILKRCSNQSLKYKNYYQ